MPSPIYHFLRVYCYSYCIKIFVMLNDRRPPLHNANYIHIWIHYRKVYNINIIIINIDLRYVVLDIRRIYRFRTKLDSIAIFHLSFQANSIGYPVITSFAIAENFFTVEATNLTLFIFLAKCVISYIFCTVVIFIYLYCIYTLYVILTRKCVRTNYCLFTEQRKKKSNEKLKWLVMSKLLFITIFSNQYLFLKGTRINIFGSEENLSNRNKWDKTR